jgi:hypothetical protein
MAGAETEVPPTPKTCSGEANAVGSRIGNRAIARKRADRREAVVRAVRREQRHIRQIPRLIAAKPRLPRRLRISTMAVRRIGRVAGVNRPGVRNATARASAARAQAGAQIHLVQHRIAQIPRLLRNVALRRAPIGVVIGVGGCRHIPVSAQRVQRRIRRVIEIRAAHRHVVRRGRQPVDKES